MRCLFVCGSIGVDSRVLEEMDAERRRGSVLVQGLNDAVHALAAHPTVRDYTYMIIES